MLLAMFAEDQTAILACLQYGLRYMVAGVKRRT